MADTAMNQQENDTKEESDQQDKVPEFGSEIRNEFMLRKNCVYLNHGSYGCVPRRVHERQVRYLQEIDEHPDIYFRYSLYGYLDTAVKKVCEFLGTSTDDTFLIQNATKGVNTVLRNYPIKEGDAFLISTLTYPAMQHASRLPTSRITGGKTYQIKITFPIKSEDDIVKQYDDFLTDHTDVKLAIVEHIASPVAVLMPVKRLVEVCHRHGVLVFVDGAHAPGQLKLDLQDIDGDFYSGNLHKWVYTPRGCAFIWMNPKRKRDWFKPLIISNREGLGLVEEFRYEGTKDDTPYLCVVDGINYYNRIGGMEKIHAYTTDLRARGIAYLEERWGTSRVEIPESMVPTNLQMIYLPTIPGFSDEKEEDLLNFKDDKRHLRLQKHLLEQFDVQVAVWSLQGKLVMRLSTNVYVTWDDIVKLADAVESLAKGE